MKRFTILLLAFSFLMICSSVFAAPKDKKGASAQGYEHASENAVFNRVSDWFATVGKSEEEKAKTLEERKASRAAKRAEQEAKKAQKEKGKVQGNDTGCSCSQRPFSPI
ncbi:hypothetical protein ACFLZ3_04150, partial [Candidatus Omnitrophota bacterium]